MSKSIPWQPGQYFMCGCTPGKFYPVQPLIKAIADNATKAKEATISKSQMEKAIEILSGKQMTEEDRFKLNNRLLLLQNSIPKN